MAKVESGEGMYRASNNLSGKKDGDDHEDSLLTLYEGLGFRVFFYGLGLRLAGSMLRTGFGFFCGSRLGGVVLWLWEGILG